MQPVATRSRSALAAALGLLVSSVWFAAPASAFEWQVDVTPAGELFPALDLSQATKRTDRGFGDGNGLVSVHITGADIPDRLVLRVDTPGLRRPAVVDVTQIGKDAPLRLTLKPRLDWDIEALAAMRETRTQMLHVALESSGAAQARDVEIRVHPLDDALYYVREGNEHVDLGWVFAGYVNPDDPVVDDVLALAREIDPDFDVGADDPQRALGRVSAIWAALERHGLRYDAGDPALSRGPEVWSQRVRLADETWRDRRANCIDGSVLVASVLERIGLHALIVLVPGHAFVGYRLDAGRGRAQFLETTLLGVNPSASSAGFDAARRAGRARWRKAAARLDGRHGPDYALIDIGAARTYGIIPIEPAAAIVRTTSDTGETPAGYSPRRGSP